MNYNAHQKVYVCSHVFECSKPVLLVSRAEGDWCFLCGDEHDDIASSYSVVGIDHLLDQDKSLKVLLDLPEDWEAEREIVHGEWIKTRCKFDD